ncbi:hypothetical protein HLV39_06505 [Marinobacter adhaerens]|uniref:Sulfatase-modifying factor enzyme domain-containing protein n=1 Tax=Marinobacter adhaerens TaxID=1033846 RepID=A0A851HMU3_9GAMM|nr:hypothetical protein [Marinobacter adhaerens]NWN91139.1 hypothetical protein [Marinobacter adhaerens]
MLRKQTMRLLTAASELLLLALLAGCSSPEPPSEQEIAEVLSDARRNLVFVKGGEFWLGDVGNEAGVLFNPIADDNKPPKRIELDGFSMLKTEVT